jgi:vacuolar-type H+-ATPase subunit H
MLRPSGPQPINSVAQPAVEQFDGVDIQQELNALEEMILDSPRLPLTGKTFIDEEQLLDQLDLIRLNLPGAFQMAQEVLNRREEVVLEAENYGRQLIAGAEARALDLTDELGIVRQAEMEAKQIRQQVQQECEVLREQVLAEVEQIRENAKQDLEIMRRTAIAESEEIQRGADEYADKVLQDMEMRLNEMMRIVRNGRNQLGQQ